MSYNALGLKRDAALQIVGISKHQYYYKPLCPAKKRGKQASIETMQLQDGSWQLVDNCQVMTAIENNHVDPDLRYGYQRMTKQLQIAGFNINHKKVYRLMKQNQLLQQKSKPEKTFVKYRKVAPPGPLRLLEMDIKFVWIQSQRRHGFILTILDVFTRKVLQWHIGMSITQHVVKEIWTSVIINHLQPNQMLKHKIEIEVRNDNDPRFSAKLVQDFFAKNHLNQVFTHPYTPQENGHIESFHAILGRSLNRFHFENIEQAKAHLTSFYFKYNNQRLHGSIAHLPPITFENEWNKGNIQRIEISKNKVRFKLKIPYFQLSEIECRREASCLNAKHSFSLKEVSSATTLQQPSTY